MDSLNDFIHTEEDGLHYYTCKQCGTKLPSGIVGISSHWVACSGKEFTDDLMKLANDWELTFGEIHNLKIKNK